MQESMVLVNTQLVFRNRHWNKLIISGKTPKQNLRFLTFFINTIKACHDNADLLRSAIATAGNDFRLGANEAPPAIFSVFIGTLLESVLEKVRNGVESHMDLSEEFKAEFKIDIHNAIPDLMKDNTDRNRTSPFAFTGNKFEFRAVGSTKLCTSYDCNEHYCCQSIK